MYTSIISAQDLLPKIHDPKWIVIDCRFGLADTGQGRRDYQDGHIPGAYYAHLDEDLSGEIIPGQTGRHPLPDIEALIRLFSGWGIEGEMQVVVYDDKTGAIAARLWWMLNWLGHEKVAVLEGGWSAWVAGSHPVDQQMPERTNKVFVVNPRPELLVDAAFVDQIRTDPDFVLVDSRLDFRFRGEKEPIDPVAGHIPGAVNAPFPENLQNDHFKPKAALKDRFESVLQNKTANQAIFYCGSGVTACHNILALKHAGLGQAKLYAGSWSDWIADGKRPVAKAD